MGAVLVLNASMEVLTTVGWQRAICLIVEGKAYALKSDDADVIRSKHLSIPLPEIIALCEYRTVPYIDRAIRKDELCSKRGVLMRDNKTCGYCGRPGADTVDHIWPQSRGGKDTWENLIACCRDCNQLKADLTLREAGMRTLWTPYVPDVSKELQQKVWDYLAAV